MKALIKERKKLLALIISISLVVGAGTTATIYSLVGNNNKVVCKLSGKAASKKSGKLKGKKSGEAPGEFSGQPGQMPPGGESNSEEASYSGSTTFKSSTKETGKKYKSTKGGVNALLVKGGTSTITNAKVTKSGDESSENSDFTGTNAGILVYNGAKLNANGGTVTTNASHANGIFAYGDGVVNVSDTTINTSSNNSGGVMVAGGGTLTANNLKIATQGDSSAAIRSDRGGGKMNIKGGTYTTNGQGSPAIYSTANVKVNDAKLIATKSEGVIIEGKNSVTLNNTTLTDTNNVLHGNSTTYKNIFIYQSMSGDASVGTGNFTAKNSTIITNKGDTFYITNTDAVIDLSNNKFANSDGDFMRIEASKWGKSGSNGGKVTLKLNDQNIKGDIIVDSYSSLTMNISNGSTYSGTINGDYAGKVKVKISKDSKITLTGDWYVDKLEDTDKSYSNIDFNGHKIYVKGKELKTHKKTTKKKTKTKAVGSSDSNQPQPPQGNKSSSDKNQPPQGNNSSGGNNQVKGDNGQPPEPPTDKNGNKQKPPQDNNGKKAGDKDNKKNK